MNRNCNCISIVTIRSKMSWEMVDVCLDFWLLEILNYNPLYPSPQIPSNLSLRISFQVSPSDSWSSQFILHFQGVGFDSSMLQLVHSQWWWLSFQLCIQCALWACWWLQIHHDGNVYSTENDQGCKPDLFFSFFKDSWLLSIYYQYSTGLRKMCGSNHEGTRCLNRRRNW